MEQAKLDKMFADLPQPPKSAVFRLSQVKQVFLPHPYCIGTKHVVVASDHFGGMLTEDTIRDAEKRGAKCSTCRRGEVLPYDEHESQVALYIEVPQNRDLNAVSGLHAYLLSIKEQATKSGIEGFAFPVAKVH